MGRLVGLFGRPFVDLEPFVDTRVLAAVDTEVSNALAQLDVVGQTGGSLKHMGITAPWVKDDGYIDYGDVIADFTFEQWRELVSLADDPNSFDEATWQQMRFGDETDHPLNAKQIRLLTYRYGVYFPWKVCVHLLENICWQDKHHGAGKSFTDVAEALFPTTTAFVRSLPFTEVGRVVLFGLLPNPRTQRQRTGPRPHRRPVDEHLPPRRQTLLRHRP